MSSSNNNPLQEIGGSRSNTRRATMQGGRQPRNVRQRQLGRRFGHTNNTPRNRPSDYGSMFNSSTYAPILEQHREYFQGTRHGENVENQATNMTAELVQRRVDLEERARRALDAQQRRREDRELRGMRRAEFETLQYNIDRARADLEEIERQSQQSELHGMREEESAQRNYEIQRDLSEAVNVSNQIMHDLGLGMGDENPQEGNPF